MFLLTRIKEAHDGGRDNREAVAVGLQRTGRRRHRRGDPARGRDRRVRHLAVIFLKEIGLGAAVAVLIDAFVVRSLLVPALMALLGEWNWWSPAPLRRLHARLNVSDEPRPPAMGGQGRPSYGVRPTVPTRISSTSP